MAFPFIVIFLLLIQSALILTRTIHVFPELYLLPWITSFGNIPYIDFIDHHGFLLNFLLAPFTKDKSFSLIYLFFFSVQTINLLMIIAIVKKTTNNMGVLLAGLLFVVSNFFLVENDFWYEIVITTFYFAIYYVTLLPYSAKRNVIIGTLAALASFTKPNAALILFPLLFIKDPVKILKYFLFWWTLVLLFYALHNGIRDLIFGLFLYNQYLLQHYAKFPFSQSKFYLFTLTIFVSQVMLTNKKYLSHIAFPFSIASISLVFLGMGYGKQHLPPLCAFLIICIIISWNNTMHIWKKRISTFLLCILIFSSGIQALRSYSYIEKRPTPHTSKEAQFVSSTLTPYLTSSKSFFVMSNQPEHYYQYYYFSITPQTRFPIAFPFIEEIMPLYEQEISQYLYSQEIEYILLHHKIDTSYNNTWPTLLAFVADNYTTVEQTSTFTLLKKN